jgi:hypothetical protein
MIYPFVDLHVTCVVKARSHLGWLRVGSALNGVSTLYDAPRINTSASSPHARNTAATKRRFLRLLKNLCPKEVCSCSEIRQPQVSTQWEQTHAGQRSTQQIARR